MINQFSQNSSTLNYLTAEQAMADFAMLIKFIKQTTPGANSSPVITIGGSYGGMLAAWMRMKYPNLVVGYEHFSRRYVLFVCCIDENVFVQQDGNVFFRKYIRPYYFGG